MTEDQKITDSAGAQAAFTLVVAFFWFQGYFYIDQLQSTARLLCFVCLVGLAITMRNKPQRRY